MALSQEASRIIDECKSRSDHAIAEMRRAALAQFGDATGFLIGINGSYARREATESSDVDLFFCETENGASDAQEKQDVFRELLRENLNMTLPASNGVFEEPLAVTKICEIGGQDDSNVTITRRMLLLLEGEWVFNEPAFHNVRDQLLKKYLASQPEEDKICMFLLNDIIRYWRTICIDLEHKTLSKPREIPSYQAPLF